MKVLVACEYSGTVRDAFIAKGHDAISCDLLPTDKPGPHYQGDVLELIRDYNKNYFDLIIGFPPCIFLCVSANKHYKTDPVRYYKRIHAANFFFELALHRTYRIAIENPIGVMSGFYRKPDQILQPWQFGHGETKATCLWLKNLPKLIPTNIVSGREGKVWKMPPSPDRWKLRSKTFQGIANAMADQWGN